MEDPAERGGLGLELGLRLGLAENESGHSGQEVLGGGGDIGGSQAGLGLVVADYAVAHPVPVRSSRATCRLCSSGWWVEEVADVGGERRHPLTGFLPGGDGRFPCVAGVPGTQRPGSG